MFQLYATCGKENIVSVTSQLRVAGSALSNFLVEELPSVGAVVASLNRALLEHPLLDPPPTFHGGDWGTVGTAFDLRVRCYFSSRLPETRSAMAGARLVASLIAGSDDACRREALTLWDRAVEQIRVDVDRIGTGGRRLDWDDEDRVNAHCLVLTLFEQCFRAGPRPDFPAVAAMREALASDSIDPFLELPKDQWLEDLRRLSWRFIETQGDLVHRRVILNPIFAGSVDVGGADGDLIVEDRLIELKSSRNPLTKEDVYQALTYVLLDYDDTFRILRVAFYAARRGSLLTWDIADLVRGLSIGPPRSLADLRASLCAALAREFVASG